MIKYGVLRAIAWVNHHRYVDVRSLYQDCEVRTDRPIPNRVYQTWKDSKVDRRHALKIKNANTMNPNWAFEFFDDAQMTVYMRDNWSQREIWDIFQNAKFGATRADIWRLCILYDRGGVYLDFDATISSDLDKFIGSNSEVIGFETNKLADSYDLETFPSDIYFLDSAESIKNFLRSSEYLVANWLLAFAPRHKILEQAIRDIEQNATFFKGVRFKNPTPAIVRLAGPMALTRAVWTRALMGDNLNEVDIGYFDVAEFKITSGWGAYGSKRHYSSFTDQVILNV